MEGDTGNLNEIENECLIQKLDQTPERFRDRKPSSAKLTEIQMNTEELKEQLEAKNAEIELLRQKDRENHRIIESLVKENRELSGTLHKIYAESSKETIFNPQKADIEVIETFYIEKSRKLEKQAKSWERKAHILAGKYYQILDKIKKSYSQLKSNVISLNERYVAEIGRIK